MEDYKTTCIVQRKLKNVYSIYQFLSLLNYGYKNKKTSINIRIKPLYIEILSILQQLGCIYHYEIKNQVLLYKNSSQIIQTATIHLKYFHDQGAIQQIFLISRPSKLVTLTVSSLQKLVKKESSLSTNFILSTSKGILTHEKALNLKIGGILLAKIN